MAADLLLGDPQRGHPVAGFGTLARHLEKRMWRSNRLLGAGYAAVCIAVPAGGAAMVSRRVGPSVLVAAGWTAIGGRSLVRVGVSMAELLEAGRIPDARAHLGQLCARDSGDLDAAELARATVESVAENTSDAVVAPLFWGLVAGAPGVVAYRAANTLDAMVGYRSPRYERFGWAAARTDDLLNLVPARICALLTCALAPAVGGSPRAAWAVLRRDGSAHPSPNAGRCEAAFAGALAVRLGGANAYGGRPETRATLGDGHAPGPADIRRAARLSTLVGVAAAGCFAAAAKMLP